VALNESAKAYMGLENPVGEIIRWNGKPFNVVGVFKDMIVESPYEQARPSVYFITDDPADFGFVFLRINPASGIHTALNKIEASFITATKMPGALTSGCLFYPASHQ
jgi:putative ABC transport system permease protein